jgi:hypothetical protein
VSLPHTGAENVVAGVAEEVVVAVPAGEHVVAAAAAEVVVAGGEGDTRGSARFCGGPTK